MKIKFIFFVIVCIACTQLAVGYAANSEAKYTSASLNQIINKGDIDNEMVCSGIYFNKKIRMTNFLNYLCMLKKMEAAGVIWVSKLINVHMIRISGVMDSVQSNPSLNGFKKNFLKITTEFKNKLKLFFNRLTQ